MADDKLATISNLSFPTLLSKLKKYLGITSYLHQYIPEYAIIAKPLQMWKTALTYKLWRHMANEQFLKDSGWSKED